MSIQDLKSLRTIFEIQVLFIVHCSVYLIKFFTVYLPFTNLKIDSCTHCLSELSHVMRKPDFAISEQQRGRSACASVQPDQRLYSSLLR